MTDELEVLRFVRRADVYKAGALAATLTRERAAIVFCYEDSYLQSGGPPVATTLPFSPEPVRTHAPGALPPFFSGLLPEGRRLSALRRAVKTSADDELSILLAVGSDSVGDVKVVPEGDTPAETEPRVVAASWGDVRFATLYAEAAGNEPLDRYAIPGVQDKVSARMISLPVDRAGDRFILKLDPPEFPHLVENEAFFMRAAHLSGLPVAKAEVVHDSEGRAGLLVERFDRVPSGDGSVRSVAQEDGCQVLGLYPADKYRLTVEEVVGGLVSVTRARPVAALELLRQVAFAFLTCNGDAHAKNFSVVRPEAEWRVSPAYDLPSSYPYGDHTMALTIAGRSREDIDRDAFVALGEHVGLPRRATEKALDALVDRCGTWLGDLDELPFDSRRVHKLRRAAEYRRARLGRKHG